MLQVAHLPWEVLCDGVGMLMVDGRMGSPGRMVVAREQGIVEPVNRPLQMLFMTTSPEGVTDLNYEQEESNILTATDSQPLLLVTEESGSIGELENLVASYDAGYFDVFNLTGHGVIRNGVPYFLTESDVGGMVYSTAQDIAGAFGSRFPKVMFLSGCHTGEVAGGAVPSMVQQLVMAGAEVVLGWARPVYDRTAIVAAQALYKALAMGDTVEQAIAKTLKEMLREYQVSKGRFCSDWHLLRVYRSTREISALVTPLKTLKRAKLKRKAAAKEFLGAEPVASAKEFVGRRRPLQRCLKALRSDDRVGVFLHGMGGLGKSSLCARLCDRMQALNPQSQRVVIYGVVDEVSLIRALEERYVGVEGVTEILNNPKLKLGGRLQQFFELVEECGKPLVLVLDDFEQNILPEAIADGSLTVVTTAIDVLAAIGRGLEGMQSKVIVTCRYDVTLPRGLDLYKEQLGGMRAGDVQKQCQRLELDVREDLTQRLIKIADGNPRLLRWLSEVVTAEDWANIDLEAVLEKLEGVETRFRENLLVETLLAALSEDERRSLARWSVVQLPVSEAIVRELVGELDLDKLMRLTLVEPSQGELYRVPMVLHSELAKSIEGMAEARQAAVRLLHRVWWEEPEEGCDTDRAFEVLRLGLAAEEWAIAVTVGDAMATSRVSNARYVEAEAICEMVLSVHDDYRMRHQLARSREVLGKYGVLDNYEKALAACPDDDLRQKSALLGNLAGALIVRGDIDRALQLWNDSLELKERIGDVQGKAATLSNMAGVIAQQGDIDRALQLWNDSLELKERIGDVQGKAATLSNMAGVIAQQGDIDRALQLWNESLELLERIGDVKGKAATLSNMAGVIAQQGDIDRALQLWNDSLELKERISDVQGKAATLANMGGVLAGRGDFETAIAYLEESIVLLDRIRDFRVGQVRQMLEQVRGMAR